MNIIVVENRNSKDQVCPIVEEMDFADNIFPISDAIYNVPSLVEKYNASLVILDVPFINQNNDAYRIGQQIRSLFPDLAILYITDVENLYSVLEAIRGIHAAYIFKPFLKKDLEYAITSAISLASRVQKHIRIRTFGNFEVFVHGTPVSFRTAKAKELLALLVDRRGGTVTTEQAIATLWENRANDAAARSLYSKVGKALTETLRDNGIEMLVRNFRGAKSICIEMFDCDFYDVMDGVPNSQRYYFGQYMADYSWSEYRIAKLDQICRLKNDL